MGADAEVAEITEGVLSGDLTAERLASFFAERDPPHAVTQSLLALAVSIDAPAPLPELLAARVLARPPGRPVALPAAGGRAAVVVAAALGRDVDAALARTPGAWFAAAAEAAGDPNWERVRFLSEGPDTLRAAAACGCPSDDPAREATELLFDRLSSDPSVEWALAAADAWFGGDVSALRRAFGAAASSAEVLALADPSPLASFLSGGE